MTPNESSRVTRVPGARRRWSTEERNELLARFAASGRKAAQFCREEGLSAATFSAWCRKARSGRFARVRIADEVDASAGVPAVQIAVSGGYTVSAVAGTDIDWLARLLRALREA
jgi:hypothetical protein